MVKTVLLMTAEAQPKLKERIWLESNVDAAIKSKANTRELTYRALIDYLERTSDT